MANERESHVKIEVVGSKPYVIGILNYLASGNVELTRNVRKIMNSKQYRGKAEYKADYAYYPDDEA